MKKSGRYTFALLVTLAATSFIAPMVKDKATGFTVNGLHLILTSSVKEIISARDEAASIAPISEITA